MAASLRPGWIRIIEISPMAYGTMVIATLLIVALGVFLGGAIQHTAVIPIAGDQVTNDIAVSMRTPTQYAEEIKIKYACALSQLANPDETIEVPSVGDRPPRRDDRPPRGHWPGWRRSAGSTVGLAASGCRC